MRDTYVCATVGCNELAGTRAIAWGTPNEDEPICNRCFYRFAQIPRRERLFWTLIDQAQGRRVVA